MPILKILPNVIDSTENYVFNIVTANSLTVGGTNVQSVLIINQGIDATQNTRLSSIETINTDQNTAISIIQGVDATQNTRLGSIETINTNQNTSISIIQGVDLTQNTNITVADSKAQAAFDKANTAPKTTTSTTAPSSPTVGDMWYDTDTDVLLRYTNDGTSNNWVDISGPILISSNILVQYTITSNVS